MNPAISHLFWKEYRSQRLLWLILAAFPPCLGLLVAAIGGKAGVGELFFFASLGVGLAFAVASSLMLFALDEEDGTAIWTRLFPVGTYGLLGARFAFVVLGTLSLLLATLGTCGIISAVLNETMSPKVTSVPGTVHDAAHVAFAGINLLLISVWSSLRCRKVFTALFLCVVMFVTYRSIALYWDRSFLVPVLTMVSLVALIVRAAHVWHRGCRQHGVALASAPTTTKFFPLRVLRSLKATTSNLLLQFSATRSPASRRTIATLTWMELRQMLPFVVLSVGIGALLILTRVPEDRPGLHIPLAIGIVLMIIEAGLRVFRHDQQQLNGLFWSHRGVSPGLILCLRVAFWMASLLFVATFLIAAEEVVYQVTDGDPSTLRQHPTTLSMLESFSRGFGEFRGNLLPAGARYSAAAVSICLIWCAGTFLTSLVCSCWIRRWIVAAFVALMTVTAFSAWYVFLLRFGYPLSLTAFPLLATLFAAVFFTRHSWMDRRMSRRLHLQQAAWIVVPCLIMIPVQRLWRMTEIPVHVASYAPQEFQKMGFSELHDVGPVSVAWQRFVDVTFSQYPMIGSMAPAQSPREDVLERAVEAIDRIDEHGFVFMPPRLRHRWTRYDMSAAVNWVCSAEIQRLQKNGEIKAACDRCLQAFRIQETLLQNACSHNQWNGAHVNIQKAMESFRDLVTDEDLTEEELSNLLSRFNDICRHPLEVNFSENRHASWQQVLFRTGYLWDRYQKLRASDQSAELAYWPKDLIEGSYSERYRMMQLMQFAGEMDTRSEVQRNQLEQWLTTSSAEGTGLWMSTYDAASEESAFQDMAKVSHNARAASGTVLALQLYHAKYGQFPERLHELQEEPGWNSYTEFDGRKFEYFPGGFGQPLPLFGQSKTELLHPDQPLLVSHGPAHCSPMHLARRFKKIRFAKVPPAADRVIFLDTASLRYLTPSNFRELEERYGDTNGSGSYESRESDLLPMESPEQKVP